MPVINRINNSMEARVYEFGGWKAHNFDGLLSSSTCAFYPEHHVVEMVESYGKGCGGGCVSYTSWWLL